MLKTLQSAFKIKDIRQKIFFTFLMLIVIRIGSQIPVPGVNSGYFAAWFAQQSGDALNFFDAFTGGSFTSMSIFALNISPYITSSIIIQLLTIAIPKLEEMQKEEDGRQKINKITRYTTVLLAFIEGTAMTIGFEMCIRDRGNYALGIKEQLIFPEIEYDKVDKVRGMDIIFVTTAKTDEEARELLAQFNMPFAK